MAGPLPPSSDASHVWSRTPILLSPPNPPSTRQSLATPASQRTPSLGLFQVPLDDPGLSDGSSSSSSTASSTPSFGLGTDFPGRGAEVVRLLNDTQTFPDGLLYPRAHAHLPVLCDPKFAKYNIPPRAKDARGRVVRLSGYHEFSVYKLFRALFDTPTFVPLLNPRYVSAIICASAPSDVDNHMSDASARDERRELLCPQRLLHLGLDHCCHVLPPLCCTNSVL